MADDKWPMGSCCSRTAASGVAIPLESTSCARGRVVRHAAATRVTPVQVRASAPGTSSTRVETVLTKRSWWVRFPRSRLFAAGEPIRVGSPVVVFGGQLGLVLVLEQEVVVDHLERQPAAERRGRLLDQRAHHDAFLALLGARVQAAC